MLATLFGGETPVNFATWMGFACPIMLVNMLLTWIWLQYYFMGAPWGKNKVSLIFLMIINLTDISLLFDLKKC